MKVRKSTAYLYLSFFCGMAAVGILVAGGLDVSQPVALAIGVASVLIQLLTRKGNERTK